MKGDICISSMPKQSPIKTPSTTENQSNMLSTSSGTFKDHFLLALYANCAHIYPCVVLEMVKKANVRELARQNIKNLAYIPCSCMSIICGGQNMFFLCVPCIFLALQQTTVSTGNIIFIITWPSSFLPRGFNNKLPRIQS